MVDDLPAGVRAVLGRMSEVLAPLEAERSPLRHFLATYGRTTRAVGEVIVAGAPGGWRFEDGDWVERWDVAFAERYLNALDAYRADPAAPPWPWRLAFGARADLSPLVHVLLGINAHINYDLPQALLAVISDADFADAALLGRRERDHRRIDDVLAARVAAENRVLQAQSALALLDRVLTPVNRAATRRFLREARAAVWHNTRALQAARSSGDDAYRRTLGQLEVLSAARVWDLMKPGQVLLRLAVSGFGVTLPPG